MIFDKWASRLHDSVIFIPASWSTYLPPTTRGLLLGDESWSAARRSSSCMIEYFLAWWCGLFPSPSCRVQGAAVHSTSHRPRPRKVAGKPWFYAFSRAAASSKQRAACSSKHTQPPTTNNRGLGSSSLALPSSDSLSSYGAELTWPCFIPVCFN